MLLKLIRSLFGNFIEVENVIFFYCEIPLYLLFQ